MPPVRPTDCRRKGRWRSNGRTTGARGWFEQALRLHRANGDQRGQASCLFGLAEIALRQSQLDDAQRDCEEASELFRINGDAIGHRDCIRALGDVASRRADDNGAEKRYLPAKTRYRQHADDLGEATCAFRLADIAQRRLDHDYAGRCQRALAYTAANANDRAAHLEAARQAWQSIGREDLLALLEEEFGSDGGNVRRTSQLTIVPLSLRPGPDRKRGWERASVPSP